MSVHHSIDMQQYAGFRCPGAGPAFFNAACHPCEKVMTGPMPQSL